MTTVGADNNPPLRYDSVAQITHWLMVLLVTAEFVVGWSMPEIEWGTEPEGLIAVHLTLGATLFVLVLFRVLWRLTHPAPALPPAAAWQRWLAALTHLALYAMLLVMALTGWASASSREWPVRAFGLIPLPALLRPQTKLGFRLGDLHADLLGWVLLGIIALHVVGALYHRFIKRDAVMSRMLSWS